MWDLACALQAEMFAETAAIGGLDVQLVYYRGLSECRASKWVNDANRLAGLMESIGVIGGHTQIRRVLEHVRKESRVQKVDALVFVGDAMEESLDGLCDTAGRLGLLGVKAFMFHEGGSDAVAAAYGEIARLTGGAAMPFDSRSPAGLAALLRAVAAYAAGGAPALDRLASREEGARLLLAAIPGAGGFRR